ncbi:MAG TPA: hypothetical protein VFB26_09845 [Gaiellaceae bacterium]|nr:hypothetical protein [Gaiellaceae bacterium]
MPEATVPLVEPLRVEAVQTLHAAREALSARVEHEVVMSAHETERVHAPEEASDDPVQEREERAAVVVVAVDRDAAGATCVDVEEPVGEIGAKPARHCGERTRQRRGAGGCGNVGAKLLRRFGAGGDSRGQTLAMAA